MPIPWSVTLISTLPSPGFLTQRTTRVRSGLYTTAFSSRFRTAVTSRSSSPRTLSPRTPMDARVMPRAFAFIRHRSSASATTSSTCTGRGAGTGSAAWIRESVIRSWTRNVSLAASCRIRPANRRTASSSSAASSIVSASSASAPTGVLSSWLTLATKSRLTCSTRWLSVRSSASTRTSPPPPTVPDSEGGGAAAEARHRHLELGLADLAVAPDLPGEGGELAHHQPVALDDPEGAGGRARAQHPVLAVHHDRGRREHGQHRGDAGRQLGGPVRGPGPGAHRRPAAGRPPP